MITPHRTEDLLQQPGRTMEVLVGCACAAISVMAVALLVGSVYVLVTGGPSESISGGELAFLVIVLAIAIGFSILAFRLFRRGRARSRLMSPILLRAWGLFFGLGGVALLVDGIFRKSWSEIPYSVEISLGAITMGYAAFVLARKWSRMDVNEASISQQDGAANGSQPIRSETNRTSSAAGSRR